MTLQALFAALSSRKIKLGGALFEERSQARRPWLDSSQVLHWPVLLLYGEVMTSDLVEDFCEIETFAVHLDDISFCSNDAMTFSFGLMHFGVVILSCWYVFDKQTCSAKTRHLFYGIKGMSTLGVALFCITM